MGRRGGEYYIREAGERTTDTAYAIRTTATLRLAKGKRRKRQTGSAKARACEPENKSAGGEITEALFFLLL